ncbi:DUF3320 domain-containing protein [Modestobacter sp. I12A-02662]|uniref:DUF3320 domain-containing protein n=1 Tax=Modestobacter sp. I12A-02662 TaxID=1730496 RepID=UPI0034DE956E
MGTFPCPQRPGTGAEGGISISADPVPVLSEALARAGIPVVAGLRLTTDGDPVRAARVTVTVRTADGDLGRPVELTADVVPGRPTVLTDVPLVLDADRLAAVPEPCPASLTVQVEAGGTVLASATTPLRVLGAGQWLASPPPLALELLAAHVLPDDPAVAGLVGAATDLLRSRTADPLRVDETAAAIVEGMRRRGIRPRPVTADWRDVPQRVRTPAEVLEERAGTTLDVAVTLAAAFEHAGLRPLLWVAADRPHAFLGYWRVPHRADGAAVTDVTGLAELVERGLVQLVETALLRVGAEPATFGDLHRTAAATWLTGDLHRLVGVTDVHRARLDGVVPLPGDDGLLGATRRAARDRRRRAAGPTAALLDLDLRGGEDGPLPLTVPPGRLAAIADQLGAGAALTLLPADQLGAGARRRGIRAARDLPPHQLGELLVEHAGLYTEVPSDDYAVRLGDLAERARRVVEERGTNDLCLALGSLAWEVDGRPARSPLLLVPVVLAPGARAGSWRISADPAGTVTPNGCLLGELRRRHSVAVPEDAADLTPVLRQALAAQGLPFRVETTAELTLLPAAAFRVREDADRLGAAALRNPLVPVLLRPGQPFAEPEPAPGSDLDELAAALPLPADGSQLRAVADAAAGHSFVLEGAPGTGKTQAVANLVAAAVADARRVLVVGPQPRALDVLARRLDAAGLGALTLALHGAAGQPAAVRAHLRRTHERAFSGSSPGAFSGSSAGTALRDELRDLRRRIAEYTDRLHAPNAAGMSAYSAHAGLLSATDGPPALAVPPEFVSNASARTTAAVRRVLAGLPEVAARTRPRAGHPWGFLDSADVDPVAVQAAVVAVDRALAALPPAGPLARVVAAARTPEDLDAVAEVLDGPAVPLPALDATCAPGWDDEVEELLAEVAGFTAVEHPGLDVADPRVLDLPLVRIAADARDAAVSGRFGRGRRLSAVLAELAPTLRPGAAVEPPAVPELIEQLLDVHDAVRDLAARAAAVPGLLVPWNWNPLTDPHLLDRQVAHLRRLRDALTTATAFLPHLRRFLDTAPVEDPVRAGRVRRLRAALAALPAACATSARGLQEWAGDGGVPALWESTQPGRAIDEFGLPSLARWLDLLRHLHLLDAAGLSGVREVLLSGAVPARDAVAAFDRGFAQASFVERRAATGLSAADARAQEEAVRRFLAASAEARAEVRAGLAARALAARDMPEEPALDAPDVCGLLTDPGAAALTPCVLATPDTVARSLPATAGSFDLVVVLEASRLPVADALGALGRATAAVVVGDRRQLPPPGARPGEDLLTACLRVGVPRRELGWQHRAPDGVSAFADAVAYGNRLSACPAPGGPEVSLVRVAGAFARAGAERHTNDVEARAVVAEVLRRFAAAPDADPSIAVVTLHPPQRRLVERLLRGSGDDRVVAALDAGALLVRDVDTVSGEHRDLVLLSLACAPDARGGLPLEFGPLGRAGGERRLTVAVTRARRQVVVYASFPAALLRPAETSALGVRQLRAYLDVAAQGPDAVPQNGRPAPPPDPHREDVAAALRGRGLVVSTDVGLSGFRLDLIVARAAAPEQPVLAVLLDGPAWAQRSPVVDRVAVPAGLLAARGWPAVERVWLPEWLADREAVVDRLTAAAASADLPAAVLPAAEPVAEDEPEEADEPPSSEAPRRVPARPAVPPARLADEQQFRPWTPDEAGEPRLLRQLDDPETARRVRRVLAAGIAAEGPIHRDRLAALTASAFGIPRVNAARIESILALLPDPSAEFLWPAELDPETWTGFRRHGRGVERPLEHVPPEEIGNAMVALCRAGSGMTRDDLFLQTLVVFGHRRRHPVLLPHLEVGLAHAVRASRVVRAGSGQPITAA